MLEGVSVHTTSEISGLVPINPSSDAYLLPGKRRRPRKAALFTPREIEVLEWVAKGKTDWQTAQILFISRKTVNYHVERAKRKLQVPTRVQAVLAAVDMGLMPSFQQQ